MYTYNLTIDVLYDRAPEKVSFVKENKHGQ